MTDLGLWTAAFAGLVSFLSPCVLPLIPGYISFISGVSFEDLQQGVPDRKAARRVFWMSVAFVLGFSVVFIALGASATVVGGLLLKQLELFRQIAGVVIILFGIHLTGLFRIPFLLMEKKIHLKKRPLTGLGAFLVGIAFAFGWTPCIGPILAGILALAATEATVARGVLLLAVYSLGLGIPFLLTSLFVQTFWKFFTRFRRYLRAVEIASGLLLIGVGVLIFTDRLTTLIQYLGFFNRFAL